MSILTALFNGFCGLLAMIPEGVPGQRSFWMPERASTVAADVDWVFDVITWISIFFFVLITVLLVIFAIRYRRTKEVSADRDTTTHHMPLEMTWTIIPLILVIIIFYMGMQEYIKIRTEPVDSYDVRVTARRWTWEFEHANGCRETGILRVPVNRPVKLIMRSDDVLHSAFIPAFRVKQDVVPGRITTLWFEATRTGVFELFCAEYCGTDHSQMIAHVYVYDEDQFLHALDHCARWIDELPEHQLHIGGAHLFRNCVSCHTLDGRPDIGPSFQETHELYHARGERTLDDGRRVPVDDNYIRSSIVNPRSMTVAGYLDRMPLFPGLSEREIDALTEFIKRLDEFELDQRGRPIIPELEPQQAEE
jgi:cytochrome c oxidase subunit II